MVWLFPPSPQLDQQDSITVTLNSVLKLDALSANNGDYDSVVRLSEEAYVLLDWFISSSHLYNGLRMPPNLVGELYMSVMGFYLMVYDPLKNSLCILIGWSLLLFCLASNVSFGHGIAC